uniref:Uncharacterized protein n=1 Tax=Anguilla anguilla TaxID=7936 RepID=A0A0E9W2Q2_ANGAN
MLTFYLNPKSHYFRAL